MIRKQKTPANVLLSMVDLLDDPAKWIKAVLARDKNGVRLSPCSPSAYSFCLIGASLKVSYMPGHYTKAERLADEVLVSTIQSMTNVNSVAIFNDSDDTTHKKMLEVLISAAFLALSEEE